MNRSEVNKLIREAKAMFREHRITLPPFGYWTPQHWETMGSEADEIRECSLGWDLTDFGSGDFHKVGLLLFTLRNGSCANQSAKRYAEKIMIVEPQQVTPWHYHEAKMEDIINRGGGNLCIQAQAIDADNRLAAGDVTVSLDGVQRSVPAGTILVLQPGESITVTRRLAHQFWGEPATGKVLVGEVSDVNDDHSDNYFLAAAGRFPALVGDAPPLHLLCTEYPVAKAAGKHGPGKPVTCDM
jgi:D-lyxose ketol-isomerase